MTGLILPAPLTSDEINPEYVPQTEAELLQLLAYPKWRVYSGCLYKIMIKGDDDDEDDPGFVAAFKPNAPQRYLFENMHTRSLILKARQLGFTTAICILFLDHVLFNKDQRAGIVAHDKEAVKAIFRDKVQFAYNSLPSVLRDHMPLKTENASEYLFAHNNSSIRVGMSMRSGTIHRLHVSEMGKLGAKFPGKAEEIVTGSLPAVPKNGIAFIESTAEGQSGTFYDLASRAEKLAKRKRAEDLTQAEWRFFFFPWWKDKNYQMDPKGVEITDEDHAYFDDVETQTGNLLSMRQRAWYVSKRANEQAGDEARMWREYPSTSDECWQASTEGKYYPKQLAQARVENRIRKINHVPDIPVHSFWDIGSGDGTGIWLMQMVGGSHRFLKYLQGWGEGLSFFTSQMDRFGYTWGYHYLPHDADHERQGQLTVAKPIELIQELKPSWDFRIVPRVQRVDHRHTLVRKAFPLAEFDQEGCADGLAHLANYQKSWSTIAGAYTDTPLKNNATEAADSFGQWAQALEAGELGGLPAVTRRNRPGALAI